MADHLLLANGTDSLFLANGTDHLLLAPPVIIVNKTSSDSATLSEAQLLIVNEMDLVDTDIFYVWDSMAPDNNYNTIDTFSFLESQYLYTGHYNLQRPFTASIHNSFKSYATIRRDI